MGSYKYTGKLEALTRPQFEEMVLESNTGTRISRIDKHQVFEDTAIPTSFELITKLSIEKNIPYWMIRGIARNPHEPASQGRFLGEDYEGNPRVINVVSIGGGVPTSLISVLSSQKNFKERFSELQIITQELQKDYGHFLPELPSFDALYQAPTGELYGQTMQNGRIVEGPIHLATIQRRTNGKYSFEAINEAV